ncbi:MAG TPA: hypothetical protein VJN89_11435 [Candidatus Acidoferrum sp.]|nr:hypothetical protein [Candidatus Acidoferrum sp.]
MLNASPVAVETLSTERCNHINARGHRCRMLVADPEEGLCPHHLGRLQAERARNDEAMAELLGPLDDFSSAANVNFFLGNLLKLMARKRIDRRDALAQAYICQLLLNTFPHMRRELESGNGPEGIQLMLDTIANSQKASPEPPDSGGGSPADAAAA